MKRIIHERFNAANKAAVAKFEKQLYEDTKMLGVLVQNQFEEEFYDLKEKFNKELNDKNFKSFEELTKQFVEHLYEEQLKSGATTVNPILQDRLLEQS